MSLRNAEGNFRYQLGMLPRPIAGALDLHDDGIMKQSVERCRCDDGIVEHIVSFSKSAFDVSTIAP